MKTHAVGTLAAGLVLGLTVVAALSAQTETGQDGRGRGAPAPRNLQVLPKDTPTQDVVATMQQFTRALGVQCTYCHIQVTAPLLTAEEAQAQAAAAPPAAGRGRGRGRGQNGPQMDFAADDKRQKLTARVMLTLVSEINAKIATLATSPGLRKPGAELVRVQCATCHRGVPNPQLLPDLLSQTMTGKGEAAAVALYRDLRQQYLGTEAYDFRESVLLELGRQSLATQKPDDALAWLLLNVEFYPKSAESYVVLAQVHARKKDQAAAVKDLEKAIAIDPGNIAAKRQLDSLRKSRDIQ
jgi:mono/diheme cytochrome c family protein